jgi:transposase InsO family protein
VFLTFREWKSLLEKSTGHKLKIFHTDNGGEFTSTKFEDYLREEGVKHEYTISKTPQQNGVSERMNRTLVEAVRSMLVDAKLPHRFWAEALSTAAYLINRSPTKTLGDKTPSVSKIILYKSR